MTMGHRVAAMIVGVALAALASSADAADPDAGQQLYAQCQSCHGLAPEEHRVGPSLHGIFGREAGTAPGFTRYSQALVESGIVWDEETMRDYIADPLGYVPGSRKTYPGVRDAEQREDLVAYLLQATRE